MNPPLLQRVDAHERWLQGRGGTPLVLEDASLAGAALAGRDLSQSRLTRVELDQTDLTGARLVGAELVGCSLVGARLDDAELAQAVLTDCDASRSSLRRAELLGVTLERGVADGADLQQAALSGRWHGGTARGAYFERARLLRLEMFDVDLHGAAFDSALLRKAILHGGRAAGARFRGAKLVASRFHATVLAATDWHDALLHGVVFDDIPAGEPLPAPAAAALALVDEAAWLAGAMPPRDRSARRFVAAEIAWQARQWPAARVAFDAVGPDVQVGFGDGAADLAIFVVDGTEPLRDLFASTRWIVDLTAERVAVDGPDGATHVERDEGWVPVPGQPDDVRLDLGFFSHLPLDA